MQYDMEIKSTNQWARLSNICLSNQCVTTYNYHQVLETFMLSVTDFQTNLLNLIHYNQHQS